MRNRDDDEPDPWNVNAYGKPVGAKTLAERYAEKFGKLPHHRMKPETIRKRLEAE